MAQQASAQFTSAPITQVVTSAGGTGTENITGDATLISFVSNGVTYDSFIGLDVTVSVEPVRVYASTLTDPGTAAAAISDLNLATGTLNINQNPTGNLLSYNLTGQTLDADTTIFIFTNGGGGVSVDEETGDAIGVTNNQNSTPPNTLTFINAAGDTLGTVSSDYFLLDPAVPESRAPNLISVDLVRPPANPLNGRTISGAGHSAQ